MITFTSFRHLREAFKKKLWTLIERAFLKSWLRRLERAISRDFDRALSLRIDAVRYLLETIND